MGKFITQCAAKYLRYVTDRKWNVLRILIINCQRIRWVQREGKRERVRETMAKQCKADCAIINKNACSMTERERERKRQYRTKGFLIEFWTNLIAAEFITNYASWKRCLFHCFSVSIFPLFFLFFSRSLSLSFPFPKLAESARLIQFPFAIYYSITCCVSRFLALPLSLFLSSPLYF